jgi:hypothetical protein
MTTIEKLRAKMNAAADPKSRYLAAKELIQARRAEEASGHAAPKPIAKPIQPKQNSYHEAKARIAQKGGTSTSSPASASPPAPARRFSQGVQDWETDPPMHMRERVESAREHSA